jgi:hypothetical protein
MCFGPSSENISPQQLREYRSFGMRIQAGILGSLGRASLPQGTRGCCVLVLVSKV